MVAVTAFLPGMKARGVVGVHQTWALGTLHSQLGLFRHMPVSHEEADFHRASSTEMLHTRYVVLTT